MYSSFNTNINSIALIRAKILRSFGCSECNRVTLTLLHSEGPKLYGVLVVLSAVGLKH